MFAKIDDAERILGYSFRDKELLLRACTHPYYGNEHDMGSYERLEFVGDSIIDFVVADELYRRYPDADEGALTKMRAAIVSKDSLSGLSENCKLADCMLVSRRAIGPKEKSNIIESTVAAVYYDGGIEKAREATLRLLSPLLDRASELRKDDFKTVLKEYAESKDETVEYRAISQEGPPHRPIFTYEVAVGGKPYATGRGSSKKDAEEECAKKACAALGIADGK